LPTAWPGTRGVLVALHRNICAGVRQVEYVVVVVVGRRQLLSVFSPSPASAATDRAARALALAAKSNYERFCRRYSPILIKPARAKLHQLTQPDTTLVTFSLSPLRDVALRDENSFRHYASGE